MNNDMQPTSTPPTQPVSVHETPHAHHGALPLIAGMLGVFLVIETVVLGYVVKEYVVGAETAESTIGLRDELEKKIQEAKDKLVPFLYTDSGWEGSQSYSYLKQVNRQTGDETIVLSGEDRQFITLVATPQIGYDGRVFIHQGCVECDNPYYSLYELDMNGDREPQPLEIVEGFLSRSATAVSPDQTKIAIAQYEDVEASNAGEVLVYDFLSGDTEVLGELAEDEYFSQYFGPNAFAGAGGYTLSWINRECFNVTIYEEPDDADPSGAYDPTDANEKDYKEMREYCIE